LHAIREIRKNIHGSAIVELFKGTSREEVDEVEKRRIESARSLIELQARLNAISTNYSQARTRLQSAEQQLVRDRSEVLNEYELRTERPNEFFSWAYALAILAAMGVVVGINELFFGKVEVRDTSSLAAFLAPIVERERINALAIALLTLVAWFFLWRFERKSKNVNTASAVFERDQKLASIDQQIESIETQLPQNARDSASALEREKVALGL